MSLTAKQDRFAEEYMVDLNATQAAIRAGYSKKTAYSIGHENLKKPEIQDRITELRKELSGATRITVEGVVGRLDEVAQRCMQAHPVLDSKGEQVYVDTPDGELAPAYTFQATGANRALELIGKHVGAFTERVEHTGKDGAPLTFTFKIDNAGDRD